MVASCAVYVPATARLRELVGSRADQLDDLGRGGVRRTGGERWLRVVLDPELDPLRPLCVRDLGGELSAMSIPAETPAAVMILP